MITRQQIIDIFNAIKDAVEGAIPAGANAIGSVDVDNFPVSQTVDGEVTLGAGTNAIGSVDVDTAIQEYQWISTDGEPTPAAGDRVFGIEINAVTHAMTVKYWTGAAWEDLA